MRGAPRFPCVAGLDDRRRGCLESAGDCHRESSLSPAQRRHCRNTDHSVTRPARVTAVRVRSIALPLPEPPCRYSALAGCPAGTSNCSASRARTPPPKSPGRRSLAYGTRASYAHTDKCDLAPLMTQAAPHTHVDADHQPLTGTLGIGRQRIAQFINHGFLRPSVIAGSLRATACISGWIVESSFDGGCPP